MLEPRSPRCRRGGPGLGLHLEASRARRRRNAGRVNTWLEWLIMALA